MRNEQDEKLNRLLSNQGSVAEQTQSVMELDDQYLLRAIHHSKYALKEWERRLAERAIEAVKRLGDEVTGLTDTIYRANQGIQERTDKLLDLYDRFSGSQGRQQKIVIILTLVLALSTATYTWITWQSVSAMREANEIQRQLLHLQKASSSAQAAPNDMVEPDARKSDARGHREH